MTTVCLGFIHPNVVTAGFMQSVLQVSPQLHSVIMERGGPAEIGQARNRLVHKFLQSGADYLWFVDTDIIFKPGALGKLLSHGKLVVSANYSLVHEIPATFDWETKPCAYQWLNPGDPWGLPGMKHYDKYEGLMKVDACGAGCLLIHRSVFDTLGEYWFSHLDKGEDIAFCLRLTDNAIPLYYDADLKVLHQKTVWV